MRIDHAAMTHQGRRKSNEDAHCVEPRFGLFAVADGMGGYEGGEVASRLVVGTLAELFRQNCTESEGGEGGEGGERTWPYGMKAELGFLENLLDVAVRTANREVVARKHGALAHMGSTVAALAVRGREVVVAHVGDSRVYRLRDGRLGQLTRDHSLYAEMEAAGSSGLPHRRDFPWRNVITRAIGMSDARCDMLRDQLRAGDVYLLCTDGLLETVEEADIAGVLGSQAPEEACRTLVNAAFTLGGRDNITAVVVRVLPCSALATARHSAI